MNYMEYNTLIPTVVYYLLYLYLHLKKLISLMIYKSSNLQKSKKALISLELQTMNFKSIYNIPVSASRRTCGGNAPHYRWDYKITTGR